MYIEYGEIQDDVVVVDTTSVKIDTNREIIPGTESKEHSEFPIIQNTDSNIETNPISYSDANSNLISYNSYTYQPYSKTYSLKIHKLALTIVQAAIVTATGLATGPAGTVASAMINTIVNEGKSYIPDSVYFSGKRAISKSVGKLYDHYKGNFYMNSSKKKLLASNLTWSRRWGH